MGVDHRLDDRHSQPSGATVVHGFVRTEEGEPVADAVLTLVSPAGKQLDRVATLADGAYILSAPSAGSYLLAVTSGAYEPWTRHIAVGGDPLVHDLALSPSSSEPSEPSEATQVSEAASPSHPA
ncbi:carboxypeptidase-like regulatory domain-containing protein [Streptomyces sp. NPDC050433]|uniref:carboxypeptidase-like regulatory domain-containing protein n=1 Tax=Streptomyces sp. NPDC050433 TaxID=3365615 RepID=UPI0037AD7F04